MASCRVTGGFDLPDNDAPLGDGDSCSASSFSSTIFVMLNLKLIHIWSVNYYSMNNVYVLH